MGQKPKFRTMYMHTLDGKPVVFRDFSGWYLSTYAGGRIEAQLLPSLRAIRLDIKRARECLARRQLPNAHPIARRAALNREFARYGYVLVRVPS